MSERKLSDFDYNTAIYAVENQTNPSTNMITVSNPLTEDNS